MIRPLATFLRALDAARTAGTLARTVRILARQLDNAHLLAASEEARADRAEAALSSETEMHGRTRRAQITAEERATLATAWGSRMAEALRLATRALSLACSPIEDDVAREVLIRAICAAKEALTKAAPGMVLNVADVCSRLTRTGAAELRVAELEAQLDDWREASGGLAADPQADALPDLTDAGEAPIPIEPPPDAYHERDRADRLQAMLQACEVDLATARAQLRQTEAAAGAHIATISALREAIAAAHRAAHAPAPAEQIPGVAAARTLSRLECTICPYVARELDEEAGDKCPACGSKLAEVESCDACGKPARDGERTGEAEAVLLCGRCTCKAEAEEAARATAGTDDPPPTRPSERTATRTT